MSHNTPKPTSKKVDRVNSLGKENTKLAKLVFFNVSTIPTGLSGQIKLSYTFFISSAGIPFKINRSYHQLKRKQKIILFEIKIYKRLHKNFNGCHRTLISVTYFFTRKYRLEHLFIFTIVFLLFLQTIRLWWFCFHLLNASNVAKYHLCSAKLHKTFFCISFFANFFNSGNTQKYWLLVNVSDFCYFKLYFSFPHIAKTKINSQVQI